MEQRRRGRKPKNVSKDYPTLSTVGLKTRAKIKGVLKKIDNQNNLFGLNQNLILHIPIKSSYSLKVFDDETEVKKPEPRTNKIQYSNQIIIKNNFRGIKDRDYPRTTDIRCWWCTYNFTTVPCGIPFNYIEGHYEVYGCFCSFNCALAYLNQGKFDKKNEKLAYLYLMYRKIFGKEPIINPSPPKEILTEYGGNMTIEEYRELCNDTSITKNIVLPPITGIHAEIDTRNFEESIDHMNKKNTNILINFKPRETVKLRSDSFMDFFKHD